MGMQLRETISQTRESNPETRPVEHYILLYWIISLVLSLVFLSDWLTSWNVPDTFSRPWLVGWLVLTWGISQAAYITVARHDNRPLCWSAALLFAIGNGVCETLSFGLVYRLGEVAGMALAYSMLPDYVDISGFVMGLIFFTIYGGLIHGLFWIKLLPPHFDSSPHALAIRQIRPGIEVLLVSGWSLCFWLTRDIWTVVFFHALVDLILMLRVRPPLFQRPPNHAS